MNKEARNYLMDAMALRRASQRHKRLGWHDSARNLWVEAKSRLGLARMWCNEDKYQSRRRWIDEWYKGNVK